MRVPPSGTSRNRRRDDDDYEEDRGTRRAPDLSSIHKALFSERKSSVPSTLPFGSGSAPGSTTRQKFTVVMPKGQGRSGNRRR